MCKTIRSAQTVEGQANRTYRAMRNNRDEMPLDEAIRASYEETAETDYFGIRLETEKILSGKLDRPARLS